MLEELLIISLVTFFSLCSVPVHIQIMGVLFQSASLFANPTSVLCAALDSLYWLTIENGYLQVMCLLLFRRWHAFASVFLPIPSLSPFDNVWKA